MAEEESRSPVSANPDEALIHLRGGEMSAEEADAFLRMRLRSGNRLGGRE